MAIPIFSSSTGLRNITNITRISSISSSYQSTIQDRYNQVQGKSESELAAMGLKYADGTYWQITSPTTSVAWLTKNNIDSIAGRYEKLLDSSGNYAYPLDIPQGIMADVVNKYGSTLSKDELIKTARDVYQKTGNNLTDQNISTAIAQVQTSTQQTNPDLADKMADSTTSTSSTTSILPSGLSQTISNAIPTESKSFFKKYGIWLLGGGIVIIAGIIIFKPTKS